MSGQLPLLLLTMCITLVNADISCSTAFTTIVIFGHIRTYPIHVMLIIRHVVGLYPSPPLAFLIRVVYDATANPSNIISNHTCGLLYGCWTTPTFKTSQLIQIKNSAFHFTSFVWRNWQQCFFFRIKCLLVWSKLDSGVLTIRWSFFII